jgi:hypothetical protein
MENEELEQQSQSGYTPRPRWQVWLARVAVVIMIISIALYYWHIASGGMQ